MTKMKLQMRSMSNIKTLLAISLLFISSAFSEVKIPSPKHLMDVADVFNSSVEDQITSLLREFNKKTKATMYVVILDSLQGESIEGFSIRAIDTWGKKAPGDASRDDGILLTIALKDRKIRFEVGQGLEGKITDSKTGNLIRAYTEYLKQNNYARAVHHFIDGAAHYINGSSITGKEFKPAKKSKKKFPWFLLLFLVVFFFLPGGRGGRGGFYISTGGSSGGFSGGGGSFGSSGGGFSGGGASGSW